MGNIHFNVSRLKALLFIYIYVFINSFKAPIMLVHLVITPYSEEKTIHCKDT